MTEYCQVGGCGRKATTTIQIRLPEWLDRWTKVSEDARLQEARVCTQHTDPGGRSALTMALLSSEKKARR